MTMAPRAAKHEFLGAVTLLRFSASGALLYVGVGATLFLYDVASGALLGRLAALSRGILHGCDCVDHLDAVDDARRVGAFFGQKRVACFAKLPQSAQDVAAEEGGDACFVRVGKQRVFRDWVFDARVLTDGAQCRVAVGLAHNFVQIWSPASDRIERSVQCGERCILYALAFHGRTLDELVVAAGTVFQHILLWNPAGAEGAEGTVAAVVQPSQRLHAHDGVIFKLAWSEDARQLASVSDDRTVQLWSNVQQSEEEGKAKRLDRDALLKTPFSPVFRAWGHTARVWDVQFCAPDRLASASEDGVCKIWSFSGDCLATLTGHVGKHVWRVGVRQPSATSGAIVATGGGDGAVKLWDVDQQIWAAVTATPEQEAISSTHGYSRTISIAPPTAEEVHTGKRKSGAKTAAATNSVRNILVNPLDGGATAFVATEHGEIFRVTLATGAWSRFFVVPSDGKANGLSTCALGMDGLFLLLGDVYGRVFVVSTRTGELVYSWAAHERARVMKIWWVQDDKSSSPRALFTCSADGCLAEWTPEFEEPSQREILVGMTSVATFRCPGKCAATSLVVLDRASTTRNVICGDGRGSLFVFHRSLTPSGRQANEQGVDSAVLPAMVVKAVHGREQVSTLLLDADGDDDDASRLFSGGHDGSICSLLVEPFDSTDDTGAITLRLVARESVKGLATVKQLAWYAVSEANTSRELLVFGFHASNAVLHNLSAQYRVFSLACGGWRRPHALWLHPNGTEGPASALPSHSFVFTPPMPQKGNLSVQITMHSTSPECSNQIDFQRASLHARYHGKMTTCVAFVDANRLVTAAEDNSLILHLRRPVSQQDASDSRWTSVSSGVAHTTTVRALVAFRRRQSASAVETILVSAGGKQRVNVWRVRDSGARNADVLQFVCGHEPSGALQDHRILGLTTFALTSAVVSEASDRFRLVVGCNSEGAMPLLVVDMQRESITQLGELALPSKKPILSCAAVQRSCSISGATSVVSVLAVGSTDGLVSLFNVSEWLARLSATLSTDEAPAATGMETLRELASALEPANSFLAHDMGVNCMVVAGSTDSDATMTLLSGGDDQSLRLSEISLLTLQVEREATAVNASGSAIKAVASAGDVVLIAGYDQRVSMFRMVSDHGMLALEWQCAAFSECADIADLAVQPTSEEDGGASATVVVVVGQGLQTIEFQQGEWAGSMESKD